MNMPLALSIKSREMAHWRTMLLALLLYTLPVHGQGTVLEVIPLKYRTAEQIIPTLKPMLDKNGSMSGMQNQLIVRTTPANLAELKKILASLDAVCLPIKIFCRVQSSFPDDGVGGHHGLLRSCGSDMWWWYRCTYRDCLHT